MNCPHCRSTATSKRMRRTALGTAVWMTPESRAARKAQREKLGKRD